MLLSAQTIRQLSKESGLIQPCHEPYDHEESGLSGGLTCAGYDVAISSILPAYNKNGEMICKKPLQSKWQITKERISEIKADIDEINAKEKDQLSFYDDAVAQLEQLDLADKEGGDLKRIKAESRIKTHDEIMGYFKRDRKAYKKQIEELRERKEEEQKIFILKANSKVLGCTEEKFNIPLDVAMDYRNKSTLARLYIESCATIAEAGWKGYLTLEIKNVGDEDVEIILGQPIGQVLFFRLDQATELPYKGKYQNQPKEPVSAK